MKSKIIDRLIQIEEEAAKITQEAEDQTKALPVTVQQKCDEIENKYKTEYENKREAIEAQKESETAAKLEEIKNESTLKYDNLTKYFEENHLKWEEEIFASIIEG